MCNIAFGTDTDIVKGVGFMPSRKITIGEVIAQHGEPDSVLVSPLGLPHSPPQVSMVIFFDRINTRAVLANQDSEYYELTPDSVVYLVTYSGQSDYQASRAYSSSEWLGYGIYDEYYNP